MHLHILDEFLTHIKTTLARRSLNLSVVYNIKYRARFAYQFVRTRKFQVFIYVLLYLAIIMCYAASYCNRL